MTDTTATRNPLRITIDDSTHGTIAIEISTANGTAIAKYEASETYRITGIIAEDRDGDLYLQWTDETWHGYEGSIGRQPIDGRPDYLPAEIAAAIVGYLDDYGQRWKRPGTA